MIEKDAQPLSVARRVLGIEALAVIGRAPFTRRGWAILDRWAMNSPASLRALEAQGLHALQSRLLAQQEREADALLAYSDQAAAGVPELELLQLAGIDTELAQPEPDDLASWDAAPAVGRKLPW